MTIISELCVINTVMKPSNLSITLVLVVKSVNTEPEMLCYQANQSNQSVLGLHHLYNFWGVHVNLRF